MNIDVIKGHDRDYLKQLMDISYHVMLDCFGAPDGDRYQILTQHEDFEMNILDTGLRLNPNPVSKMFISNST